jgi:hypothetical protein
VEFVDGWCRAWPQSGRISDAEGYDEGYAPPFYYTLAFALQLMKIMEILSAVVKTASRES